LGRCSSHVDEQAKFAEGSEIEQELTEFQTFQGIINRAEIRGLPGGVHGTRAEVSVDQDQYGSTIIIRAGALALYTVISFGADGNLKSIGAFEDLEPVCAIEVRR
jgi:hypothetical protein